MDFIEYFRLLKPERMEKNDIVKLNEEFRKANEKDIPDYVRENSKNFPEPNGHVKSMLVFDAKARFYDIHFSQRKLLLESYAMAETLNEFVRRDVSGRVADVSCGTGTILCYLALENPKLSFIGLDFSKGMIGYAKEKKKRLGIKNVDFVISENQKTPLPDESVDLVYDTRPDWYGSLAGLQMEMHRILKTDGLYMSARHITKNERSKRFHGVKDYDWFAPSYTGAELYPKTGSMIKKTYADRGRENAILVTAAIKR
ncbi:MAG: methyltransferase domain-containing protein [Candidatus Aenigmarchaeota archaeon]|nr:methyltransferase domain-containing protein [Candidatus Aenigmarchaeota archaeon]